MKTLILLPTQLFDLYHIKKIFNLESSNIKILLIEEPYYFTSLPFHKQKLVFHRASMKCYYEKVKQYYNIEYIEFNKVNYKKINSLNNNIIIYDPIDKPILEKFTKIFNKKLIIYDSPAFLETNKDLDEYRNNFTNKKNYYHDASFYKWQRKRLNILMQNNKPILGKWSFDKSNRLPYKKDYKEKSIKIYHNHYIEEAQNYVKKHFNDNFGEITNIYYPISHTDALKQLKQFIKYKILDFGPYQDGISKNIIFGSHSVLSPFLNNGLITPDIVIKEILKYYNKLKDKNKHIASIEGLLRQIIGWRSYVRFIYLYHGKEMYEMNYLKHNNKLSSHWFNGTTNIEIIDHMIHKVSKYAYLHHIERLMVMGNFALLTLLHPKEVYKWFMICFIDSYEWVMIPNVFGMSQFALENISMMTRPYVSSSNYLFKMSDFNKGEWSDIWDALYWNFINKHKNIFKKNYSIALQVKHVNNMDNKKLKDYILNATNYIKYIK